MLNFAKQVIQVSLYVEGDRKLISGTGSVLSIDKYD